jgi:hypothetical protein
MASKRKKLTIFEKVKIIHKVENNPNMTAIDKPRKFYLAPSSLSCTMKKKQSIVDEEVKCRGEANKRKNRKSSPCDETEKVLIKWFEGMRSSNLPINGTLIKEKAIRVAKKLKLENFKVSNEWLGRFKKRHGLTYKNLCEESASVDKDTVDY